MREDIEAGRAPRPKVLDMFAGGGSIPLEALRLGCEAYALDLNPVAHIIELCTLVYPQKYGKPDISVRGMTGPKNEKGETTWGGLAEEVRYWGNWVLEKVKNEIGDLYPPIPDPEAKPQELTPDRQTALFQDEKGQQKLKIPGRFLTPVAYLWTRTVHCKNPNCGAIVPLVKQTWLCKKKGWYVALRISAPKNEKQVRFEVVEATTVKGLGFDPSLGSKGGNATCPFCGTVADSNYVKAEGCAKRMEQQMMAFVCIRSGEKGKSYFSADAFPSLIPKDNYIRRKSKDLCEKSGLVIPNEFIEINPRSMDIDRWGFKRWQEIFTPRQMLCLLSFTKTVLQVGVETIKNSIIQDRSKALITILASMVDRLADFNSSLCVFNYTGGRGVVHTFGRQALPMVWDFAETDPFNPYGASWVSAISDVPAGLRDAYNMPASLVQRGSATELPWNNGVFDAVITDPPYYDNVSYSNISDFF
jgi:putative DNA methylase